MIIQRPPPLLSGIFAIFGSTTFDNPNPRKLREPSEVAAPKISKNPMKHFTIIPLLLISALCIAQSGTDRDTAIANPNYDQNLAERLGGDDFGMKSYYLVILKTGTNSTKDQTLIDKSFRGHLDNIQRLADAGQLIVAGPLGRNDREYRGIFILDNLDSRREAEALLDTDPAIKIGLLDYEIFDWYGSAALPEYLPHSDKIWKLKP